MDFGIKNLHELLVKKEVSCQDLIKSYLDKIKAEDGKIHAFLEVFDKESLQKAKEVDKKIKKGEDLGLLEGLPIALKDNLLYKDHHASAASRILENYVASYNATAVEKLLGAGSIIIGRTNMDEFAMGSSTENSAYGPTKNPRDLSRVPGGSSGGSAASVAAGMSVGALGSDTAGSVRQPASFCGVVGLKPTYGAVSRYGLIAMASSLDQIGPFANTVEDTKIIFEAIRGRDSKDFTSKDVKWDEKIPKKLRVGLPKEYLLEGLDPQIKKKVDEAIKELSQKGAEIIEVSLPHTSYALAAYYLIMPAEVSSNLARFDGIRYGLSLNREAKNLYEVYAKSRAAGFGAEAKRRIILGTFALSSGYYDAYYKKARQVQEIIRRDFTEVFEKVDCLLTPTAPTTAFKLNEKIDDPLTMYLSDVFTAPVNLAGLPAVSFPYGKLGNLPVGLQFIGQPFGENLILNLAASLEKKD